MRSIAKPEPPLNKTPSQLPKNPDRKTQRRQTGRLIIKFTGSHWFNRLLAALAEGMYSGSVGRKQPLFSESDLAELRKPLSK